MSAGHGQKRERFEELALAALLSEPTIPLAAKRAGISESTLLRWLATPEFRSRHREVRRQVVEHAIATAQQATSGAVEALRRNLTCGSPAGEIAAAKAVLDVAIKGGELIDLEERVDQLEQQGVAEQAREEVYR